MAKNQKVQRPAAAIKFDTLKFIKYFNHYKKTNQIARLDALIQQVKDENIKPAPDWVDPIPNNHRFPGLGPYIREELLEAIRDKKATFKRVTAKGGAQRLIVTSPKTKFEIVATPLQSETIKINKK